MLTRLTLAIALFASLAAQTCPARADDYALDEGHTGIVFAINHMGMSVTYGRFNKATGSYVLDPDPAKCSFKLTIDAASVDTNNPGRDKHLTNPDFFNAGEFPLITFESKKVTAKKDGDKTVYEVTGELNMHGVKKEVTLPLVKLGEGPGMKPGEFRSGFSCDTTLKHSEFGITKFLPGIGDDVKIMISFEGIKK